MFYLLETLHNTIAEHIQLHNFVAKQFSITHILCANTFRRCDATECRMLLLLQLHGIDMASNAKFQPSFELCQCVCAEQFGQCSASSDHIQPSLYFLRCLTRHLFFLICSHNRKCADVLFNRPFMPPLSSSIDTYHAIILLLSREICDFRILPTILSIYDVVLSALFVTPYFKTPFANNRTKNHTRDKKNNYPHSSQHQQQPI